MTKATGVGRGGRRANPGGRPPKAQVERRPVAITPEQATVDDVEKLAKAHTALMVAVLVQIATEGDKEASRVAAAKAILDRGHGAPSGAPGARAPGKKEAASAAAKQMGTGRFATPAAPPKLATDYN